MIERCKECGANLAMVGRSHRCVPGAAQTLALARAREAKEAPPKSKGLRITSHTDSTPKPIEPIGDGVALTSMAHPPGLIEKIAEAIKSGKLRAPRGTFDRNAYMRDYMRKRRQAKAAKGEME